MNILEQIFPPVGLCSSPRGSGAEARVPEGSAMSSYEDDFEAASDHPSEQSHEFAEETIDSDSLSMCPAEPRPAAAPVPPPAPGRAPGTR
jgi:hypothetical protein